MDAVGTGRPRKAGRRYEVASLLLLFLTLLLLLSLISYLLPLFGVEPHLQEPGDNWCGALGFYTAHYLFSFFGLVAFFPLFLLSLRTFRVIRGQESERRLPHVLAGMSGIALASSGLFGAFKQVLLPATFVKPGGYLGTLIWPFLNTFIGTAGSVMALFLLLLFSLMAAMRFSLTALRERGQNRRRAPVRRRSFAESERETPMRTGTLQEEEPFDPEFSLEGGAYREEAGYASLDEEDALLDDPLEEPVPPRPATRALPQERERSKPQRQPPVRRQGYFKLPQLELLDANPEIETELDREHYYSVSNILVEKLQDFGVQGEVAGISPGPVVTTYEFSPAPGVKISRVVSLADDLAMVLKVDRVRIVGSIPGKVAIGIEIPNPVRSTVYLRDILLSDEYQTARSKLSLALGFDVVGKPVVANLARMPHLLIAGATGAGKSVAINAFIASILFKATPEEVRLLMIDPKRIELSVYDDIPHLLHPVVVEAKMASRALLWAVREMERRYRLLEERRVKSFLSYNEVADEPLPYIVIIVDELADLMMVASKDVETSIARLAQMARAAGMHIVLATQRPSVDVLTGLIKANFPTRISFKVSSKVDSRTILDGSGAEHLLGMGDMLFLPPGAAKLQRIHGAFISEQETERLVEYLKSQGTAEYDVNVLHEMEEDAEPAAVEADEYDEKYDEAVAVVTETGVASISMVQRRLRVGYNRAARMIELMEREGIVGPADGSRPREVLVRSNYEADEDKIR
ncbi:MAG: DNA translocase FtsK 4TM domain-containing protein [bacterium]|nr:DNA translocase FtsK 4TM domain-containing protein [bacterium]